MKLTDLTRPTCARPGCDNPLNTGSTYCGRSCAAQDRGRAKARKSSLSGLAQGMIPQSIADPMVAYLGQGAYAILDEFAITLAEMRDVGPPPLLTRVTESGENDPVPTYGVLHKGKATYRPTDALGFDTIDEMLRNGQVQFGMAMKESWLLSVFRNPRSYKVQCKDEKLSGIVQGIMERVLMRHASDFTKAMPYGAGFFEKVFDYQPAVQWGIEGVVPDSEKIYGYKSVDAIHPKSIDRILYTDDGKRFAGFVQKPSQGGEIKVPAERALTLTYDKRFRNLWGIPMFEPTYVLWFWYEVALRSFLRYLERMGTPVAVCEAPSRGQVRTSDGVLWRTMKYAMLVAGNTAKSNAIALPSDVDPDTGQKLWSLSYLTAEQRGAQFVEAIEMLGTLIIRSLVIGDRAVTQGSEVGSYAAANKHFQVTMLHNEHILTQFVNQFNKYLIPQLAQYNIGTNAPPARMVTEGLDPDEKDRLFTLLNTMGNQADTSAMEYIDWVRIFEVENIPVLSDEDVEKLRRDKLAREEERMTMQQQFAAPPGEKAPPGKKPSSKAQEKVKASADWMLYNIVQGARVPLVLSSEQALGIAERFSPEPFKLFNPFHDELGRFAAKAAGGAAIGGALTAVSGLVVSAISEQVRRRKMKSGNSTAISIKVRGKIYSMTYSQVSKKGRRVAGIGAKVGAWAWMAFSVIQLVRTVEMSKAWRSGAYENAYKTNDWNYKPEPAPWPEGATQAGFKSMYRDLAKAFHPDVSVREGAAKVMREINEAYSDKDWATLVGLHKSLESGPQTDEAVALLFFLEVLMESIREGAEFLAFDTGGKESVPPFPVEDGVAYIDAQMVENLYMLVHSVAGLDGSSPGEATAEAEGFFPISLFNPYHDELGRFTTGVGGGAVGFAKAEGVVKDITSSMVEEFDGVDADKVHLHKTWPGFLVHTFGIPALGAYSPITKSTHISPKGLKAVEGGKEIDFFFGKYKEVHPAHPVVHEILHSRAREGGKTIPVPGPSFRKFMPLELEEGSTELLSRKFMRDHYGHQTKHTIYEDWSTTVADWAWHTSGGNANKAWGLVNNMHKNTFSFKTTKSMFAQSNSGWKSGSRPSYKWLREQLDEAGIEAGAGYSELMGFDAVGLEAVMLEDATIARAKETDDEIERWVLLEQIRWSRKPGEVEAESAGSIALFNPFHDVLGRFTTSSGPGAFGKDAANVVGRVGSRLSHMPGSLGIEAHESQESAQRALGGFSKRGLAAFHDGKIHVTPRGGKILGKNKRLKSHVLTHEAIHGRLRANGEHAQMQNLRQAAFEEGSSDLMAAALSGSLGMVAYKDYVASVATLARGSSRNQKQAWEFVSDAHYNNGDPQFAPSLPRGNWEDVEWLMKSTPKKLEDESMDGLEEWVESEREKWKHLYGLSDTEGGSDQPGDDRES